MYGAPPEEGGREGRTLLPPGCGFGFEFGFELACTSGGLGNGATPGAGACGAGIAAPPTVFPK